MRNKKHRIKKSAFTMSGTASVQPKKMNLKPRRTGYSLFCMEKAKEDDVKKITSRPEKLRLFGQLWRNLPEEVKAEYRSRAASLQPPDSLSWRTKEWHKNASRIYDLMDKMQQLLPTDGFLVLRSGQGEVLTHGTSRGKAFIKEYPGLVTETFRAYLDGPGLNHTTSTATTVSVNATTVSVKAIQDIFNHKYSVARGIEGLRYPYSNKKVRMDGLPNGIPLKHPSKYGLRQLRAIFAAKDNLVCIIDDVSGSSSDAGQGETRPPEEEILCIATQE